MIKEKLTMTCVEELNILKLHELFVKKTISPVELIQETINRAQLAEPKINAFREFTPTLALKSARVAENKFLRDQATSYLSGIPFSVKDNIDVANTKSCFGSMAKPVTPDDSAPVVKSLISADGCLFAKTNMTEFGASAASFSPLSGVTSNPRNLDYTTGGSSAGAAADVAAGISAFAIGTDGGGSSRIPASFCGLIGFKPTFGLIPVDPPAIVGDLLHIGIIARSISDVFLVLAVVTNQLQISNIKSTVDKYKVKLQETRQKLKKINFVWSFSYHNPEPAVEKVIKRALTTCSANGIDIIETGSPFNVSAYKIFENKFLGGISKKVGSLPGYYQFGDKELIKAVKNYLGQPALSKEYVAEEMQKLRQFSHRALEDTQFLMCPTVLHKPFLKLDTRPPGTKTLGILEWPSNCIAANLLGFPAVTIPCGKTACGLPIGMQLMSYRYNDVELLSYADVLYELFGMPLSRPSIVT